MKEAQSPFLEGNFAPWRSEDNFDNLEIIGKIPDDLNGVFLRNGPNPQFDPLGTYHWFSGDGMLHAIRLKNGNASYDNRWVRTERFNLEREAQAPLFSQNFESKTTHDLIKNVPSNTANTNIVSLNKNLLALYEAATPVSIQPSNLETIGDFTFNEQITRSLSAHPRFDFKNKEILTYSCIDKDQQLVYYRLNRDNKLLSEKAINWPYPVMIHDFVNTENYVIFPLFPCTMNFERIHRGESMFMWEGDELNTWFIITDRQGNEVGRIETNPCYAYHFGNAYEEGDNIIIDAMVGLCSGFMPDRHGKMAAGEDREARLARWTINLNSKTINLKYLDDATGEFPRFDERFNGLPYRYLYIEGRQDTGMAFDRLIAYDLIEGTKQIHHFGNDKPCEPVFVPCSEKEGDGYLLTVVYRTQEDRSDVVILDAKKLEENPVAIIKIPHRIPYGFHGNFLAD